MPSKCCRFAHFVTTKQKTSRGKCTIKWNERVGRTKTEEPKQSMSLGTRRANVLSGGMTRGTRCVDIRNDGLHRRAPLNTPCGIGVTFCALFAGFRSVCAVGPAPFCFVCTYHV